MGERIMRYYKLIDNEYIIAIGTGGGGMEITSAEYDEIMSVIRNGPQVTDFVDYRLRTDLTWEAFEVEPVDPVDEELDPQQVLSILMGEE